MSSIQTIAVIFAVGPVIVLIAFGLLALFLKSTAWAAICEAIAHGGFPFGGLLYLYFVIPRFKRIFEDFGAELPAITKLLIGISDLTVNYWYLFPFALIGGLVFDVVTFTTFHRVPESRYVARTFSALITLAFLAQAVIVGYALGFAQAGLLQKLQ